VQLLVATGLGTVRIDADTGDAELVDDEPPAPQAVDTGLPLVVAAAVVGSRVVAVVDRRPPLVLSDDAGMTWRETGAGLPPGAAIAIDPDAIDRLAFATDSRVWVSTSGGVFWRSVDVELHAITALAFD
jgi:hypothetical protein